MTRLTNDMRSRIERKLMERRFSEREAALVKQEQKLALAVYNSAFSATDRRKMTSLPDGWLAKHRHVRFEAYGTFHHFHMKDAKPFPDNKSGYCCLATFEARHELAERTRAFKAAKSDLRKEKHEAETELQRALASCTTVKRLLEAWPELEPFVSDYVSTPNTLPTVPVEKLNADFRLPVKKQKEAA